MRIIATTVVLVAILAGLIVAALMMGPSISPPATNALYTILILAGILALSCFFVGELTGNFSQVDKIWSLAPIAYVWVVAWYGDFSWRLVVMSAIVTIWGFRLTFNFWLKGGYSWNILQGTEDYRWEVLRQNPALEQRWKRSLFNALFISGFQGALIMMMTLPVVVALQFNEAPLHWLDGFATVAIVLLIILETAADWQQWRYQVDKHRRQSAGDCELGKRHS